ncbi:hypothetical protein ACFXKG_21250 [Streptomyces sp. NPDC059255]|uniref:hypothetical protein n=1 Tax=Streptomyces sp. NPDC059255 TaxID=3346793 RepID=UPI0036892A32
MHRRIVDQYAEAFDGVRFSITPYNLGYTGRSPGMDRDTYVSDLAAALATYRPLLDRLGHGAATAACEVRATLATEEYDDLTDGGQEIGHVDWIDYRKTGELPIFPPIGAGRCAR